METRNPAEGYSGSEFSAICNYGVVMASWSRTKLKICDNYLAFLLEKRPLTVKFSKFCSERFHHHTDQRVVCKFCEIWPTGHRWNHALLTKQKKTKFRLALQLSLLRRSRRKSASASPNNVLRVLQISSKSVHFRQSYSRTRKHCQNAL